MKKYRIILAFILGAILVHVDVFGQSSKYRMKTVTGFGWGQRVVPNAAYLDSTLSSILIINDYKIRNLKLNNVILRKTNVTSSNSITALTVNSQRQQQLTGTNTHTFNLPNATTLDTNYTFEFNNNSTGVLTIANTASTVLYTIPSGGYGRVMCQNIGTANGTWDIHYLLPANASWGTGGLAVTGSITATGQATVQSLVVAQSSVSASDIDWSASGLFYKTLSAASVTLTFSNLVDGKIISVAITNTSTYTVTWPTVDWGSSGAPTQRTGANTDIYTFMRINGTIYGAARQ